MHLGSLTPPIHEIVCVTELPTTRIGVDVFMKKIEAIIKPHALESMISALEVSSISGLTVHEVLFLPTKNDEEYVAMLKIMIVVEESLVEELVKIILETVRSSGHATCGMVTISNIEDIVHIRTGRTPV